MGTLYERMQHECPGHVGPEWLECHRCDQAVWHHTHREYLQIGGRKFRAVLTPWIRDTWQELHGWSLAKRQRERATPTP